MIDWVTPAITVSSPAATEYLHTASVQVSFGATDALSGLAAAVATLDGVAVASGQTIQLLHSRSALTRSPCPRRIGPATCPRPPSPSRSSRRSTR